MRKYVLVSDFANEIGLTRWTVYEYIKDKAEEYEEEGVISWGNGVRKIYKPEVLYRDIARKSRKNFRHAGSAPDDENEGAVGFVEGQNDKGE